MATIELLPQTENVFLVYKEGWHNPETHPENPSVERTWTKKEALVSFKNPKKDVIVYLEGDTCVKCFTTTPELTVTVGNNVGAALPDRGPAGATSKKIRVKAADLGNDEWVDLRLSMSESFVPKNLEPAAQQRRPRARASTSTTSTWPRPSAAGPVEGVVDAVALAPAAARGQGRDRRPQAPLPAPSRSRPGARSRAAGAGRASGPGERRHGRGAWTSGRRRTAGWTWPRS